MKIAIAALALTLASPAFAGLENGNCTDSQKTNVTTTHVAQIGGATVPYTATTGFMEVTALDGSSKACVFYTSYSVPPAPGAGPRPLTFAFNGGPGSASLWLHLGFMGPKRVDMGPDGMEPGRATELLPNQDSPLDVTDIVMIDPVATGFSHTEGNATNDKFFGVKNDYTSIERFIQAYLTNFSRWDAPKFVLGESYGGIRGSLLAHHLQSDLGIGLSGVILISPALSDIDFFGETDNNVPYWTVFPSFAVAAWFHQAIAPRYQGLDAPTVYAQARDFANGAYRDALDRGNSLDPEIRGRIAQAVSDFTGIEVNRVRALDLKISPTNIFTEIGASSGRNEVIGRYDSRFSVPMSAPGPHGFPDPSDNAVSYPFTSAINNYLRVELGFTLDSPYQNFASIGPGEWPSEDSSSPLDDVMPDLSRALIDNPRLHVMIASGYFDLACPMGTVEYELNQMQGGPTVTGRIEQKRYLGGHMMYINPVALHALKADVASFIQQGTGQGIRQSLP